MLTIKKTNSLLPTLKEVDELLEYLPIFSDETYEPVVSWHGGTRSEDDILTIPFPEYEQTSLDFFRLLSKECWNDYDYEPSKIGKLLKDADYISTCSLVQIKSLLTYCMRGERFADGHWEGMIKDGYIFRILNRLTALRPSIE